MAVIVVLAAARLLGAEVTPPAAVLADQQQRIATIEAISRPTVCIIDRHGQAVGSGVLISPDGYALTNFHVTAPCGPYMLCGLNDGNTYDAVIVGIDPTGDLALIKLFGRDDFPAAELGDSDTVRVGEWAYVVGNPFALANDFQPSVSYGVISGVQRYQYPAGTLLEYSDCLQTDAAINPGNSGGPLFDAGGRLIGINGRGSFEKRGRVNVGVGYAISINQAERFIGCLKSGRIVDHASLGATVAADEHGRVVVDDILEHSDAFRRGLRYDDRLMRFGNRDIDSVNDFKNILGTYPRNWRVPIVFSRDGRRIEAAVRLAGLHREGELVELVSGGRNFAPPMPDGDEPKPQPQGVQQLAELLLELPQVVRDHYEARPGYANYWFNRYHQQRVWNAYLAQTDFAGTGPNWRITGLTDTGDQVSIEVTDAEGTFGHPMGISKSDFSRPASDVVAPVGSGGLLAALRTWQRLVTVGLRRFGEIEYLGQLPWGLPPGRADCLVGLYGGAECRFYFARTTGDLVGVEFFTRDDVDPCEMHFSDFRSVTGLRLPHRWDVYHGDDQFLSLDVATFELVMETP